MEPLERSNKKANKPTSLLAVFWALVIVFVVIASYFAVPASVSMKRALFPFAAILAIGFFVLGAALIFLTLRLKRERKLKAFLILTGVSAVGFLISVILHNVIYGLFISCFGADFWNRISVGDEPFFFILAIFICPLGFLVGVVGSIVLFVKKKRQ